ncbi:MAG: efflux RND transporter periplasmic adaptor subunit [Halieaceae bacterium]|jgi:membrane fusion protein (multidrug efflux system)|nr:efflux RND transporter periplasmic adaptor subunit [Halieaceae bacterium]
MSALKAAVALPAGSPPAAAPESAVAEAQAAQTRPSPPGRLGTWITLALLLAALVPAALWWQHQAGFVVSRNAMVRANLSELGTRVAGVVSVVNVEAGSRVRAGDVLVQLEDAHFRAELDSARALERTLEARLEAERSAIELERARIELRIRAAAAEVRRATSALQAASSEAADAAAYHDAREALLADRAVSREMVRDAAAKAETLGARADAARAEQEAAVHALAEAQHGRRELQLREQRLRILVAEAEQAAARVDRASADLAATTIRAPADGAIIRPLAQPGMAIDAGVPALSMWFSEDTWIEAWVDEASLADISTGSLVRVSSPALPGETLEGRVQAVGLATDYEMPIDYLPKPRDERMQQAPLVGIAIRLDEMPAILRPGMSAIASIERRIP